MLKEGFEIVMSVEIFLSREAEQDIAEAYIWYNSRRNGLGEDFLSCLDAFIESIRRTPEMYAIVYKTFRRGLVRRFPYAVFYEYEESKLYIFGIFTTSRDPGKWHQRLSNTLDS
jgi:hypothetical protein